jgi:hypothetical protein
MKHKLATALIAVTAGGLSTLYAWEHWPRPQVMASLGAPPTLSPLGAYKDAADPSAPAQGATPAISRLPSLHSKADEFARLTAAGATPEMLSKAYDYAKDCLNERAAQRYQLQTTGNLLQIPPGIAQKCSLGDGDPTSVTWKRILEARVKLNAYGAIEDVLEARRTAFVDDPEGWKRLRDEAKSNGLAGAEPMVLGGESQAAYEEGDYYKAAVYAIASVLGRDQEAGRTTDVLKDKLVAQAMARLPAEQQQSVISEGQDLARKWRKVS